MNRRTLGLMAVGLLAGPIVADGQAVTYDFTGVVTSSNDSAAPVGAAISGDYAFNFAAATPSGISTYPNGTWIAYNDGREGSPVENNIFATTATAGSLKYSSGQMPGPARGYTQVAPGAGELGGYGDGGPGFFNMSETDYPMACSASRSCEYFEMSSSMSILDSHGQIPYTAAGLPILSSGSTAIGAFTDIFGDTVDYRITSLVAAPEFDSSHIAAALSLLIGGVLVLKGRRPQR
jgi:hypothetical protein